MLVPRRRCRCCCCCCCCCLSYPRHPDSASPVVQPAAARRRAAHPPCSPPAGSHLGGARRRHVDGCGVAAGGLFGLTHCRQGKAGRRASPAGIACIGVKPAEPSAQPTCEATSEAQAPSHASARAALRLPSCRAAAVQSSARARAHPRQTRGGPGGWTLPSWGSPRPPPACRTGWPAGEGGRVGQGGAGGAHARVGEGCTHNSAKEGDCTLQLPHLQQDRA